MRHYVSLYHLSQFSKSKCIGNLVKIGENQKLLTDIYKKMLS